MPAVASALTASSGSSGSTHGKRYASTLLVAIVMVFAVMEVITRFGLEHASKIEGRIAAEHRGAVATEHQPQGKSVLFVGNSLLLLGVDFPAVRDALQPGFAASRYDIEQTDFLDWYYGLRRLYSEGARPDVVVLNLNARQTMSDSVRGEYFAHRLMNTTDLPAVVRDAHLSPTQAVSMLLGNLSAYYGTRSETRKFALFTAVPATVTLLPYITPRPPQAPLDGQRVFSVASSRLRQFNELVTAHDERMILVIPAGLDLSAEEHLLAAAKAVGVPALLPLDARQVSAADFLDDQFHLAPSGAARYTAALIPKLRQTLAGLR